MTDKTASSGVTFTPEGFTADNLRCHWAAIVHNLSYCPVYINKGLAVDEAR
jgi:hypothetical protein